MTVNTTTFTDWARYPPTTFELYARSSPNLVAIRDDLRARFGAVSLGIYGRRDQRGHTGTPSVHSWGAAFDASYRGLGRAVGLAIIDFLIEHSAELGVQAVHDYYGSRIWRSFRPASAGGGGWRTQPADSSGMGQSWADWLHIEVTAAAWDDGRSVVDRISPVPTEPQFRPLLTVGSRNDVVRVVQQIIADRSGQADLIGRIDGQFGPRTLKAWQNVAAFCGWPVDQDVSAGDYDLLAWIDKGWARLNAVGVQ